MKWSDNNLLWGRPLRSILAIYNNKTLNFDYGHLKSTNLTYIEKDLEIKSKIILNYKDYRDYLKENEITLDHKEREKIILKRINNICKKKKI